jgi:hypothetical protein
MITPAAKWKLSHACAIQEQDRAKLPPLIARAESEIVNRLQELAIAPQNQEERSMLHAALRQLLELQMKKVGNTRVWPAARASR